MPIVFSQDGHDPSVTGLIETFAKSSPNPTYHIFHQQKQGENGYQLLSQHYGFGLKSVFTGDAFAIPNLVGENEISIIAPASHAIILEEDIEVAPDFFSFFQRMTPLLDDPAENLLCVSAWNDNGMKNFVRDPLAVVRSDFFPGLGWMMSKSLYDEIGDRWPRGYWDDWLREPPQRKKRETIRPEISRTFHFGQKGGTSGGQYSSYLDSIQRESSWRASERMTNCKPNLT